MKMRIINLFLLVFILYGIANAQISEIKSDESSKKDETIIIVNPVFNEIKVNKEGTDFSEYHIYDTYGKEVKQGWFLSVISVKPLPPGTYFLIIITRENKMKMQFLKLDSSDNLGSLSKG